MSDLTQNEGSVTYLGVQMVFRLPRNEGPFSSRYFLPIQLHSAIAFSKCVGIWPLRILHICRS